MSDEPARRHVEVAIPIPAFTRFTYAVPEERPMPEPGMRVRVPFGRKERVGWVMGVASGPPPTRVRPLLDVLDERPGIPHDLLRLCGFMADYYAAPPGLAVAATQPSVLYDSSRDYITRQGGLPADATPRMARVFEALPEGEPMRVSTLSKTLGMGSLWPEIRALQGAGLLRHEVVAPVEPRARTVRVVRIIEDLPDLAQREGVFGRAGRQREAYETLETGADRSMELGQLTGELGFSRSVISGLEERGLVEVVDTEVMRDPFAERAEEPPVAHPLTDDQERALRAIMETGAGSIAGAGAGAGSDASAPRSAPKPVLLHGVTGSGKTRVYIEVLQRVLDAGRGAIVLVPEISLTPQTVKRFRAWFGDQVAVLHSALSQGERWDAWRQLLAGEKRIAVGARSALFAPIPDLGVVIVDEEHDGSYKQSEAPRYQARDLAVVRARLTGALCVLGSATPSLESWLNAERGKFVRVSMPRRVGGRPMPPVRLIDLREGRKGAGSAGVAAGARDADGAAGTASGATADPRAGGGGAGRVLTPMLRDAVDARLERGEQVILLLNRRGYSSFVQCQECGEVEACPNCSVSLTYHRRLGRIICHHCRFEAPAPSRCPRCGGEDLDFRGLGTEQVERVVVETFPEARIARMDVDTTSGKWAHHEILGRVERGEVDILLGTQMIAKGLDFERVTLVGVINADVGIHLPDFRASERTFQLLSQVAGRAGRGELGGEVLIQTSMPDHYALQAALAHDYAGFARRELEERLSPPYPPHQRLANVVVSSTDPQVAMEQAEAAARWVRRGLERPGGLAVQLVGPAPAPIERLHNRWRWHFLLRSQRVDHLGRVCRALMERFQPKGRDVRVTLDRDPVALL